MIFNKVVVTLALSLLDTQPLSPQGK